MVQRRGGSNPPISPNACAAVAPRLRHHRPTLAQASAYTSASVGLRLRKRFVSFGTWSGISPHDRSMITIATLVGKGIIDSSLTHHLQFAKKNGITRTEISEMLTHIAFYAGWPNAWGAFRLAKDVWTDDTAEANGKAASQREMIFPIGEPNTAYAKYFIGNSYLAPISKEQIPFNNVTFEPGCRNNWHIHHATKGGGQMLVCVAGKGWYQEEGKSAVQMLPGDVIHIPANVKHWHGAAMDSWFAHLAFEIPEENASNEWLEPVTDEEYEKLGK